MSECAVIDTFPSFQSAWEDAGGGEPEERVAAWEHVYMSRYPDLLEKQVADVEGALARGRGEDGWKTWRDVAAEMVFPFIDYRLSAMVEARDNLLSICERSWRRTCEVLEVDYDLKCVIHVGIGCGAGWATDFRGGSAILFGLEQIAGCGWSDADAIEGLVTHEMGHVVHSTLRKENGMPASSGPLSDLFSEGLAEHTSHVVSGRETWHMARGVNPDGWLQWCRENRAWLASEFLKRVDGGDTVEDFFGDWHDLGGWRLCGYWLGHEVIGEMAEATGLRELMLMDDVDKHIRAVLEDWLQ